MAKISENLLVKGARGNVGKQYVYKKQGDETHIARMPSINKNAVAADKQVAIQEQFASRLLIQNLVFNYGRIQH
jgi:hypothetical protein